MREEREKNKRKGTGEKGGRENVSQRTVRS
jgi:hypothetical protein